MPSFKKLTTLAVILMLPTVAAAKPVVMQCAVDNAKSKGWVADQIFIEYDTATGTARVVDGIVLHFNKGEPATAKISENTDKKLVVTWTVNTKTGRQSAKMAYRAAYLKPRKQVLVTAKPHGFADNLTGRGKCQVVNTRLPTG